MSFWKKVKQTAIVDRLVEEKLYEQVLREFETGVRRDGLWAKAFQNSQGDEQKANALYIGYRVQSIKDEAELTDALAEQYEVESKKTPAKLNLQKIEVEELAPVKSENLHQTRVPCNDGNCIGVIGKNGHCRLCGELYIPEILGEEPPKNKIVDSQSLPLSTDSWFSLPSIFGIIIFVIVNFFSFNGKFIKIGFFIFSV